MANPTWPAGLPQFVLQQGYNEKRNQQNVESNVDAGLAKVRRRFTTFSRMFKVTIECSGSQVTTFETFYDTTLKSGSLLFDHVHWRTRVAATYRFRNPVPEIMSMGGDTYQINMALELMP